MKYRLRASALVMILSLIIGTVPALANELTRDQQMYENLFTKPLQSEWFTPEILAQLPLGQFEAIVTQYTEALGPFEYAEGSAPTYRLTFEQGYVSSQLVLDGNGRVAGIWFGPPEPKVSGLEDATAGFMELPGQVSLIVASDTGILAAIQPDVPMAVGSAFKLAIAAALKDQVNAGLLAWDDVILLEEENKSLPSGILQTWPTGTPMTVESLAALMISLSDNTATDALLHLAGRENVEMYTTFSKPMLTTREAFTLKDPAHSEMLATYRQGDVEQKRAVLEQLSDLPLPDSSIFLSGPVAIDVEWYFTVSELVNLMAYVHELPFMSIEPGVANPDDWQHIAFKGGSEPGVLNLTTLVVSNSGNTYYVSATWNDPEAEVDSTKFFGLYSGLFSAIKQLEEQ